METNGTINTCTVTKNSISCFDLLTADELDVLRENTLEVTYKKGENICKQGTFASHVMLIEDGLVKVYLEGNNETLVLKILQAVNMIGLTSLIEGNNIFQYSAQAYVPTTIKLIEINAFKEIVSSNAQFALKVISLLNANTIITYGRFFCLTKKHTYGRLADILLCLSNRVYKSKIFPLQLSRKELAELASMSIESIARILTKFKEDELINITPDFIEILEPERLDTISQNG